MISLCMRAGDGTLDSSLHRLIREYRPVCGSYFVDQNCHQIDVVSGCGKNAKGAVQAPTLSWVFHKLFINTLTPALPNQRFQYALPE